MRLQYYTSMRRGYNMSCAICRHYSYRAGTTFNLQEYPNCPTNTCHYANVSWERKYPEIIKPKGIKCKFELAFMVCTSCKKMCISKNDVYISLNRKKYLCKKCGLSEVQNG